MAFAGNDLTHQREPRNGNLLEYFYQAFETARQAPGRDAWLIFFLGPGREIKLDSSERFPRCGELTHHLQAELVVVIVDASRRLAVIDHPGTADDIVLEQLRLG